MSQSANRDANRMMTLELEHVLVSLLMCSVKFHSKVDNHNYIYCRPVMMKCIQ